MIVSAVIVTHNRLSLLQRSVESVLNQTYENIELIVVDDASMDGTQEWCENQDFKYIRIPREKSKGGNYARNLGWRNATGKYIAFLDDDDCWHPEKIEKQLIKLKNSDAQIVHCAIKREIIEADGHIRFVDNLLNRKYQGNLSSRILYQISLITSTMMVSKELLNKVNGFDENCKFWQEYELSIRLLQHSNLILVNEPLVIYRVDVSDPNRLTNKLDGWEENANYIYKKHQNLFSRLNILNKFRVKLLWWYDRSLRTLNANDSKSKKYIFLGKLSKVFNIPFRVWDKIIFSLRP